MTERWGFGPTSTTLTTDRPMDYTAKVSEMLTHLENNMTPEEGNKLMHALASGIGAALGGVACCKTHLAMNLVPIFGAIGDYANQAFNAANEPEPPATAATDLANWTPEAMNG